jgi:hypothetical protein
MNDVPWLGLLAALFVLTFAFVRLCEQRGDRP